MSYKCSICSKSSVTGNSYSHSHMKTKRTFKPNLQKQKISVDGQTKTAYVCTKCLKSGAVKRPQK
ncbi:large subunit ribosomal protein L28 [Parelusimicrobium proximum]|uniref:50S ribosomal protein L28 n=1 Tax=Parelusimicrobium proximum TaxID=3228953 RepID=UPI003D16BEE8